MTKSQRRIVLVLMLYAFIVGVAVSRTVFSYLAYARGEGGQWLPTTFAIIAIVMLGAVINLYAHLTGEPRD